MKSFTAISTGLVLTVLLHGSSASALQQPPAAKPPQPPASKAQPPTAASDAKVVADFKARVDQYLVVRHKADDSAPPLKETKDPAKIKHAQEALVERIGAARSGAKQGDIFTPEITAYFKRVLRPESKEPGAKAIMKEDNVGPVPFKINGPYPDTQPLVTAPPNILEALPQLPKDKDLEYRFVGKHMILRDGRANTIVDYILNALP